MATTSFEEILATTGHLVYRTKGRSMLPMLHENRDVVVIVPPQGTLHRHDVALYHRGGQYVLHRVIGVHGDYYAIRGDNTFQIERVPHGAVIGVLTDFVRKGRQRSVQDRSYTAYVRVWCAIYPLRAALYRLMRLAYRAAKRLGLIEPIKRIWRRK